MTIWLVSRHPGAVKWMCTNKIAYDRHVSHLDPKLVQLGDVVIGSLPFNMASEVCARGARYINLSVRLKASDRGRELSAEQLQEYQACLEEYIVTRA